MKMVNQLELDKAYVKMAKTWGELSKANRKKVGALIVKDNQIISDGFNGTPQGFPNECEGENGETLPWVLHAESNAITKLAKSTQSSSNATLYVTLSPCYQCSKLIIQAGITRVVYTDDYSDQTGLELLSKSDVKIDKLAV